MNDEIEYELVASFMRLLVIKISGTINFDTSEDLYEYLEKQLMENTETQFIVFDVQEVSYVSSAGIGIFMSIYEELTERGGKVALIGASPTFQRVMKLTGCLEYFLLVDTIEEFQALLSGNKIAL